MGRKLGGGEWQGSARESWIILSSLEDSKGQQTGAALSSTQLLSSWEERESLCFIRKAAWRGRPEVLFLLFAVFIDEHVFLLPSEEP